MKKLLAALSVIVILMWGCSAENLLRRAIKKDPSILTVKTDTAYIESILIDTFFEIKKDTNILNTDIDSIFKKYHIDTIPIYKYIKKDIITYIVDKKCLEDTLFFEESISTDSLTIQLGVKIYQIDGTDVKILISLNDISYIYQTKPIVITDKSLLNRQAELVLIIITLILILLYAVSLRK